MIHLYLLLISLLIVRASYINLKRCDPVAKDKVDHDISVIRPQMRAEDIKMRKRRMSSDRLKDIRKGLLTLHTMEILAVNIYQLQITKKVCDLNRQLITAMCNEMTHVQDFQVKLFEYGWKPSKLRWIYWIVGFTLGFFSRLIGTKTILKTDIWLETKAVKHYDKLIQMINWDEDTRKIIEKNRSDEYGHITRWKKLLQLNEDLT